ncbi:MAG: site-specific DNA-methyltransferase, partial [Candidatus Thorarchaeota archaeon]
EDGSLWFHIDWHVSHYVKVMLDEIFGYSNFVNEIVWKRTNSPKAQSKGFGSQHDVILLYAANSSRFSTNQVYRNHDEKSRKPYGYEDDKGKFRLIEIEAQGIQRTEGRKQFEWRGRKAPYLYRKETLDEWWDKDLIYTSRNGRYTKKQYLSDTPGIPVSDLWIDIAPVQGLSKENTGFLTQKPEALLKRVIESASDPEDLVADFFAGSGTTAVAAMATNRRWILCDSSEAAIAVAKKRIERTSGSVSFSLESLSSK